MLRDIKGPVYFKTGFSFLFVLAALALLALLGFLIFVIYKKRKIEKPKPGIPPKSAYEIACEALKELKMKDLPGLGRVKEYFYELSDTVRRYTESVFKIKSPEMTTEEFLLSLKNSARLSGAHKSLLKEFLTLSDVVKFAKYGPGPEEIERSFEAARKFVDETK